MEPADPTAKEVQPPGLWRLFWTFLRIGALAFGGFMALVAVIREEIVRKRGWIRDEAVLDGISLGGIMPGPLAVNVTAYLGYVMRGFSGALVCMTAVLLPSFVLVCSLSYVYFAYGDVPAARHIFAGVMPAVAAIILSVAWSLVRKHVRLPLQWLVLAAAIPPLIFFRGFYITALVMAGGALIGYFSFRGRAPEETEPTAARRGRVSIAPILMIVCVTGLFLLLPVLLPSGALRTDMTQLRTLFLTFAGMSVTLFGGGYVMIPAMQKVIVDQFGWLNSLQFSDGIAMGQVTPGPILITAAFVGFKLMGLTGAFVATVGMFLPPAMLMVAAGDLMLRVKDRPSVKALFMGLRPAVIGMIVAAAWLIGSKADMGLTFYVVSPLALLLSLFTRVSVLWIIPGSGLAGWLLHLLGT